MKKIIGSDIGNSKTEIVLEVNGSEETLRQPSVISEVIASHVASDLSVPQIMNDLYNNLTVHITSNALKRSAMYMIGKKALKSSNKSNMEISLGNKSENDIPVVMTLGMIAASSVKEYYDANDELPESLSLSIDMVTAIPSSEYKKKTAEALEQRFIGTPRHIVVVHIGNEAVQVTLKFTNCKVTEEGKTSMLAFSTSDDAILSDYNNLYKSNKTVKDFLNGTSLHVDIGDGTTEFTVINQLQPVPNMSRGERLGVGYASDLAVTLMKEEMNLGSRFTRQDFQEWLKKDGRKGQFANECFQRAKHIQADEILKETMVSFSELASSDVDYIFVHGGGSILFKEVMLSELKKYAERNFAEVVWINSEYATSMNSRGTYILAKALFDKK
ncbi:ParM/StbA family protein [Exiguobacterium sp. BG5(2022)]|uniref:ParM/StbA family protein n=1 Tax=Exiguobacterium sp. BG5(2022) TaxID=2962595 RepID=UPI0028825EBB|nr:ParM/StbA family protein [Exiguobacterium sp. BG5(2022)]MDT0193669.1 ParM/StbA family protein [Exiguobacterium sp. BG5(2022)]